MSLEKYQQGLDEIYRCLQACNHCYDACLKEKDVGMMAECIRLDRECADVCALAIQALSRNSPFIKQICGICAEICEACGQECKEHSHEHCQQCAEACLACARSCREIAAA